MKKNIVLTILTLAAMTTWLLSCKTDLELKAPVSLTGGYAYLKVADYATSFRQVVNKSDSFNVYVGNSKVNGSFLTYGSIYPTVTNMYSAVPPGPQTIRITVNGVTTPDSVTIATFTKTFTAGNYYSLLLTDSLLNSNDAKQIFVQDNFTPVDTSHYSIRFAHLIMNDSAGKNVDVYSTRQAANLFSNVSPGTVTPFTVQNYTQLSDTLIVRRAGGSLELARINTAVLARQRAYTLVYRGVPNTTTGTKGRSLIIQTNY